MHRIANLPYGSTNCIRSMGMISADNESVSTPLVKNSGAKVGNKSDITMLFMDYLHLSPSMLHESPKLFRE